MVLMKVAAAALRTLDVAATRGAGELARDRARLASAPPEPAEAPVIRVFPAWPQAWDASFQLRARNAFVVRSTIRSGRVESVELESEAGAPCRLRNPWGEAAISLTRDGHPAEKLRGSLVEFATRRGERVRVTPA